MASCICPIINTGEWDLREHRWAERLFYQVPMRNFFSLPLNAPEKVHQLMQAVTDNHYVLTRPVQVLFLDAFFQGQAMVSIEKPEGELRPEVIVFQETYWLTKVHHGPFGAIRNSVRQLRDKLRSQGKTTTALYFWPVTCPACARERGGHKTIIFARI